MAGLSFLTHTHTPPLLTSLTQEIPLSPRFCLFSPHAQALGIFGLTQTFSWLHEFAEHPRTANSRPSCCVCIDEQKRSRFSSCRASIICSFPCWFRLFNHAQVFFCLGCTWRAESRALASMTDCEGPFTILAISQAIWVIFPYCKLCSLIDSGM